MTKAVHHFRITLLCAVAVATVLSAIVLGISLVTGTWYFDKFHSSTWRIIGTYYAGAALVSLAVGPLAPFARYAPVSVLLGVIGGCIAYSLVAYSIGGDVNIGVALGLGAIVGGPVGYLLWSEMRARRAQKAMAGPGQSPPRILSEVESGLFTQGDIVLLYGEPEELTNWIDSDRCMIVDHRSEEEGVVRDAARWLPEGFLQSQWVSHHPHRLKLRAGEQTAVVELQEEPGNCWRVLARIARLLRPDYEIRVFTSTLGDDTHAFLLRSREWWQAYRERFPERYSQLFDEVEAILPGWGIEV